MDGRWQLPPADSQDRHLPNRASVMVKNAQPVEKMGFSVTETAPFVMGVTTASHYIGCLPLPLRKSSAQS